MKTNLPPQAYTREVFTNAYEWLQTQSHSVKELAQTPDDLVALYLQARRHGHLSASYNSKSFKNDLKNLAEGLRQFDDAQVPSASAVTEKVTETTKHSVTFTNHTPPPSLNLNYKPPKIIEDTSYLGDDQEDFISQQFDPPPQSQFVRKQNSTHGVEYTEPPIKKYASEKLSRPVHAPRSVYEGQDVDRHDTYKPEPPHQNPPSPGILTNKKYSPETSPIELLDIRSKEIVEKAQTQLNLSRTEEALRMLLVLGLEKLKDILPDKD